MSSTNFTTDAKPKVEPLFSSPRMYALLWEVRKTKLEEFWLNLGKFLFTLFLATFVAMLTMILVKPALLDTFATFFYVVSLTLLFGGLILLILMLVFMWPFILFMLGNVWTTRQRMLLAMIHCSLQTQTPLPDLIAAYATTCFSASYRARLEKMAASLQQGRSLAETLALYPGLVRYDVAGAVQLGGDDRRVVDTLDRIAVENQAQTLIQSNTLVRCAYLLVVFLALWLVAAFMALFILPKFVEIFHDFDTSLPALTQLVAMYGGPFFLGISPLVLPVAAIFLFIYLVLQTGIIAARPVFFRRLFRSTDSSKLLRLFAVGLDREIPIPKILSQYIAVTPSHYLRRLADGVAEEVHDGASWIAALKKRRFLTPAEAELVESAQRTGNTAPVLGDIAVSKERGQLRFDDLLSKMIFLPMLLVAALLIGLFVISMFLPLFKLIYQLSAI